MMTPAQIATKAAYLVADCRHYEAEIARASVAGETGDRVAHLRYLLKGSSQALFALYA